jgi:hypothetical protein
MHFLSTGPAVWELDDWGDCNAISTLDSRLGRVVSYLE